MTSPILTVLFIIIAVVLTVYGLSKVGVLNIKGLFTLPSKAEKTPAPATTVTATVTETVTTTATQTPTTTAASVSSCSPCFEYFEFVEASGSTLKVANGDQKIALSSVEGGEKPMKGVYEASQKITISNLQSAGSSCEVTLGYYLIDTGEFKTDTATINLV